LETVGVVLCICHTGAVKQPMFYIFYCNQMAVHLQRLICIELKWDIYLRVGFEVLTVVMKSSVLWAIMLCSPLKVNRHCRNMFPPSSGLKNKPGSGSYLLHAGFLLGLLMDHMVLYRRR
jgi:hypothetical protein